jgi:hypothetical protein
MIQPRITQLNTWEKHVELVLEVLEKALLLLRNIPDLEEDEDLISRELIFCIRAANADLIKVGRGLLYPIVPQGQNPPHPDDKSPKKREKKKPDFYWAMIDPLASDFRRSERQFVIECKRLGKPTSRKWILNENYVQHGILRFIREEHGYAKGEKTALMIGYVQNMEFDAILTEVNSTASSMVNPKISLLTSPTDGWQEKGISNLNHILLRPLPSLPLSLQHWWLDIRDCYVTPSPKLP